MTATDARRYADEAAEAAIFFERIGNPTEAAHMRDMAGMWAALADDKETRH